MCYDFSFSDQALIYFNAIRDEITSMVHGRENPNRVQVIVPECAGQQNFTRYVDHLARMAVVVHVLRKVLGDQVKKQDTSYIVKTIELETLEAAKSIIDNFYLHKSILLEVSIISIFQFHYSNKYVQCI